MSMNELYEWYGIQVEGMQQKGDKSTFLHRDKMYMLVKIDQLTEEELSEQIALSEYYRAYGDFTVSSFVRNAENVYISNFIDGDVVLLRADLYKMRSQIDVASELAQFHRIGMYFPNEIKSISRIGQWQTFWTERLESLERYWEKVTLNHPSNQFEQRFITSFPYFLGLAENAIQLLTDNEWDGEIGTQDAATACYNRFSVSSWQNDWVVKCPTDWLYDHPARDVAEWLRAHIVEQTAVESLLQFVNTYQSQFPLSLFGLQLVYARLLFPVHFFEVVETYRSTRRNEQKEKLDQRLQEIISATPRYEET
ncbi:MAG: spore coat putative kinase YutH, partial [Bacilli bacterium]